MPFFFFWDEAFSTEAYLINRLPAITLRGISSLEVLFKIKTNYSFILMFGCKCLSCLRTFNSHKLFYRSQPCTFLSYSMSHKGYLCFSSNGKVFASHPVLFKEFVFPFSSTPLTSSLSPTYVRLPLLVSSHACISHRFDNSPFTFTNHLLTTPSHNLLLFVLSLVNLQLITVLRWLLNNLHLITGLWSILNNLPRLLRNVEPKTHMGINTLSLSKRSNLTLAIAVSWNCSKCGSAFVVRVIGRLEGVVVADSVKNRNSEQ